jgi:hypothetical protein
LFKVGKEFFVAHVHIRSDGQLRADVDRLSLNLVWSADCLYYFVHPKL